MITTQRNRLPTLLAVCLAALAMPLSFTGPAVALSAISRELGSDTVALNWVVNAFMLTFGSALMAAGTLADRYGRKRLFLCGVTLFALSSLALAAAPSLLVLDCLRATQGLGAAFALASGLAALAQVFDGEARLRVFSLIGTAFGIGLAFGPLLSGLLIRQFGWRSFFLAAALLMLLALVMATRYMHESRDPAAARLDWRGASVFTAALSSLTWAVLRVPELGWRHPLVLSLLSAALLLLLVFIVIELRSARPMLDLSLFRYPRFVGVQFLAAAPAYGFVVLLVLLPVRLIGIEGHSELDTGRLMLGLSAPIVGVPMLAAWLARWWSAGALSGVGLLIVAAGLAWLAQLPLGVSGAELQWPLLMIGTGIGLPWGLMDGLAVSVVPKERAGMAAGIFSTTRVAGEGIALALVGAVLAMLIQVGLGQEHAASSAASRLALGQLTAVATQLDMPSLQLAQIYVSAFQRLSLMLSAVTVLTALMVFAFLRAPGQQAAQAERRAA